MASKTQGLNGCCSQAPLDSPYQPPISNYCENDALLTRTASPKKLTALLSHLYLHTSTSTGLAKSKVLDIANIAWDWGNSVVCFRRQERGKVFTSDDANDLLLPLPYLISSSTSSANHVLWLKPSYQRSFSYGTATEMLPALFVYETVEGVDLRLMWWLGSIVAAFERLR